MDINLVHQVAYQFVAAYMPMFVTFGIVYLIINFFRGVTHL